MQNTELHCNVLQSNAIVGPGIMEKTEWKNESGGKQALTHKVHKALETIVYTVINNKKKSL